jgi:hypothetical protein
VTPADFPLNHCRGRLTRILDGDTVLLTVELPFGIATRVQVQVAGYRLTGKPAESGARDLSEILSDRDLYLVAEDSTDDRYRARIFIQPMPGAPLVDVAGLMKGNVDSAKAARKPRPQRSKA